MLKVIILFLIVATLLISTSCGFIIPRKYEAKCLNEHNVSIVELIQFIEEVKQDKEEVDRKFKCFTKCLLEEIDFKDENGKMNVEKILHTRGSPDSEFVMKVANDCKAKYDSEEDECEYVFRMMNCINFNTREAWERHQRRLQLNNMEY